MPDSRQHPDDREVQNLPLYTLTVSAQRNIDIFSEPGAERNMPPSPEFRNALGHIRIFKILQKMKAKHPAQADGHIGIPGKIKINLKAVRGDSDPGRQYRQILHSQAAYLFPYDTDTVGQQDLFPQSYHKPADSSGKIVYIFLTPHHLIRNGLIADNRTGDQLRKQRHIRAEGNDIVLALGLSPIDIDGIGHCLKCIE